MFYRHNTPCCPLEEVYVLPHPQSATHQPDHLLDSKLSLSQSFNGFCQFSADVCNQ